MAGEISRPVHTIRFLSYDYFVQLCQSQRGNLQIKEFESGFVQLIASCVAAFIRLYIEKTELKLRQ